MKIQPNWNLIIKWFLTIALWGATVGITNEATWAVDRYQSSIMDQIIPLVVLAWLGAVFGTLLIWGIPEFLKLYHLKILSQAGQSPEKGKRGGQSRYDDKLTLLMDLMDEDEREAFKEALKQRVLDDGRYDDGELPYGSNTLESLMDEEIRGKNTGY